MAAAVFAIVLGATLSTYENFISVGAALTARTDAQDRTRTAADRLARDLRNLASPTPDQPQAFDVAGPYDIVFKTVDGSGPNTGLNASNVKRVRYCLDAQDSRDEVLYAQTQTWTTPTPPAVSPTGTCPASGWATTQVLADHLTNRIDGRSRPLFAFDSVVLTDITSVHLDLYVDQDALRGPPETTLSTGVFLRNQNRRPTAAFTATPTRQGIVLNGSASEDPEGEPLSYAWYDGSTKIGTGITFTYAVATGSTHTLQLKVFDPALLEGVAPTQVVTA
jgi:hypothetical protein